MSLSPPSSPTGTDRQSLDDIVRHRPPPLKGRKAPSRQFIQSMIHQQPPSQEAEFSQKTEQVSEEEKDKISSLHDEHETVIHVVDHDDGDPEEDEIKSRKPEKKKTLSPEFQNEILAASSLRHRKSDEKPADTPEIKKPPISSPPLPQPSSEFEDISRRRILKPVTTTPSNYRSTVCDPTMDFSNASPFSEVKLRKVGAAAGNQKVVGNDETSKRLEKNDQNRPEWAAPPSSSSDHEGIHRRRLLKPVNAASSNSNRSTICSPLDVSPSSNSPFSDVKLQKVQRGSSTPENDDSTPAWRREFLSKRAGLRKSSENKAEEGVAKPASSFPSRVALKPVSSPKVDTGGPREQAPETSAEPSWRKAASEKSARARTLFVK